MTTLSLILSMLVNLFGAQTQTVEVFVECYQIGDNQYSCDGGTR